MTERDLIERLRDLDGPVTPNADFRAELHALLVAERIATSGSSSEGSRVTADLADHPATSRGQRRDWKLSAALAAFVVVALVGLLTWWLAPPPEQTAPVATIPDTTTSSTPATTATSVPEAQPTLPGSTLQQSWDDGLVFGESMPWALAFDNGTCCIKTVTLDGDGSHLVNIGTQGGDQPFRLTLHDGRLVVSWGDIYAYDIATGTSTLLAEATFHVPASDPSNVWMIGYPGPRISAASPEVWQVDVITGQATEPKLLESEGFVARGIPGGLALDSDNGVLLWDYESGEVVDSLGEGGSSVSDVTEDGRIAWCAEPCSEMVVTSLADGEETVYPRREDEPQPYGTAAARFSDDGRYLAAPAGNDVMLIDTTTGEIRAAMTFPDQTAPHLYVAWAPNNTDLFAADYSYGAAESVIGHYSLADDVAEVTTLPHGGTLSFVVLPSSEAGSLVP
ncbi:MAG: hypothetical protein ACLFRT_12920 [Actinomycetota bacterium]